MDRNSVALVNTASDNVALRKESVDRNYGHHRAYLQYLWSLSARRAWIEILKQLLLKTLKAVALRKESVDRNVYGS